MPAHVELAVILNNFTPFGELRRMTQFKEKSQENPFNINAGLFDYPVLMAADILLYDAQFVPVGEDQLQHLELTRTLARKFNSKFGKTFIEPKPLLTKAPRLMSLDDPMKKMSKSQTAGCLFIDDKPLMIKEKIKKAVTDSGKEIRYDPQIKPALSNLILIFSALSNYSIKAVERRFKNKGYAEFKKELAEIIIKTLVPFQKKKKKLKKQTSFIKKIISQGNKKANGVSSKKLLQIKEKIGLKI